MRTVVFITALAVLGVGVALGSPGSSSPDGAAVSLAADKDQVQTARRRGRRGPRGPRGPAGLTRITVIEGPTVTLSPAGSGTGTSEATCPAGSAVVSGGWDSTTPSASLSASKSHALGSSSWEVTMRNAGGTVAEFNAEAMCARRR